mmetsp:Transcript_41786/g.40135  ORF Transcript_41786/g.40135 Transcript_41786/m.40135 type:complete len:140 (+) Transcript_41786:445-864(+)
MTVNQTTPTATTTKLVIYAPTSIEEIGDSNYDYVSRIDRVGQHITNLEQEIRLLKDIQSQSLKLERDTENKEKLLQELDQMVLNHKKGEDGLKKENALLKLRLEKTINSLEDQIAVNESLKIKHEQDVLEKQTAHHTEE